MKIEKLNSSQMIINDIQVSATVARDMKHTIEYLNEYNQYAGFDVISEEYNGQYGLYGYDITRPEDMLEIKTIYEYVTDCIFQGVEV